MCRLPRRVYRTQRQENEAILSSIVLVHNKYFPLCVTNYKPPPPPWKAASLDFQPTLSTVSTWNASFNPSNCNYRLLQSSSPLPLLSKAIRDPYFHTAVISCTHSPQMSFVAFRMGGLNRSLYAVLTQHFEAKFIPYLVFLSPLTLLGRLYPSRNTSNLLPHLRRHYSSNILASGASSLPGLP